MTIPSRTSRKFWDCYRQLPGEIRELARKNYRLWAADAQHPALHFKKIASPNWSVRIGRNFRAVGKFADDKAVFIWEWIGTHEDYDQRY